MFIKESDYSKQETIKRKEDSQNRISYGISFLDDATGGISRNDLVLIGAPSGVGKTQLCCNIAYSALMQGKKVHYIALEAEEFEIGSRLKYPIFFNFYKDDPDPNKPNVFLNYRKWKMGEYIEILKKYDEMTDDFFSKAYKDLYTFYKRSRFDINDLIKNVLDVSTETDLIIVDHVHYFDLEDDNENRAIKKIAMTARDLSLEEGKPIILISHLRKRDKWNTDLVAGLDEFHGSSDLYKISTTTITISGGPVQSDGNYETYFRIPKYRIDGGVSRYCAKAIYNPKTNQYEDRYYLGKSSQKRELEFEEIDKKPEWYRYKSYPTIKRIENYYEKE